MPSSGRACLGGVCRLILVELKGVENTRECDTAASSDGSTNLRVRHDAICERTKWPGSECLAALDIGPSRRISENVRTIPSKKNIDLAVRRPNNNDFSKKYTAAETCYRQKKTCIHVTLNTAPDLGYWTIVIAGLAELSRPDPNNWPCESLSEQDVDVYVIPWLIRLVESVQRSELER
jgi:hypothetical protein